VWNRTKEVDQRRWLENLYQASCDMLRYFHDAHTTGKIPERNLCIVRYEDLINDLEPTMERILDFVEIKPTEAFVDEVREQAARQRTYTSGHGHSPAQFGLTPERIRADLGFVYETFGLSDRTG
jgi:omega-hydroxy-beta-dihydromenaquinone-9 sulfotransferase